MIADVTHLVKAMRNALLNWGYFRLPAHLVEKLGLPSDLVTHDAIARVFDLDKNNQLKIAPHLTAEAVHPSGNFSKMRVKYAVSMLSHGTGSAIRLCVSQNKCPIEDLTTAYFCEQVGRWYRLVTSRLAKNGFQKNNQDDLKEKISFLNFFTFELICNLEVEPGVYGWKPWQRGVCLSTKSYLWLQDLYLNELGYLYLLGGRFTTEGVENLFSCMRASNPIPTALAAQRILKSICLTQHFKPAKSSSYDEDDHTAFLSDLADFKKMESENAEVNAEDDDDFKLGMDNNEIPEIDFMEENSLNTLGGYVIKKTVAGKRKCNACCNFFVKKENNEEDGTTVINVSTLLLTLKSFGKLIFLTEKGNDLFMIYEQMFRLAETGFYGKKNISRKLVAEMVEGLQENHSDIPPCHSTIIVRRFVKLRLVFWAKYKSQKLVLEQEDVIDEEANASKSMMMRSIVK
jgi:hypothetical protein